MLTIILISQLINPITNPPLLMETYRDNRGTTIYEFSDGTSRIYSPGKLPRTIYPQTFQDLRPKKQEIYKFGFTE